MALKHPSAAAAAAASDSAFVVRVQQGYIQNVERNHFVPVRALTPEEQRRLDEELFQKRLHAREQREAATKETKTTTATLASRFEVAGLDANAAKLAASTKFAQFFCQLLEESQIEADKTKANLLMSFASKYPAQCSSVAHRAIVNGIANKGIQSNAQLDAAIKFSTTTSGSWDQAVFEKAGIGVIITPEQIDQAVAALLVREKYALVAQRYRHASKLLAVLLGELAWANGGMCKVKLDAAIEGLLGPKTADDLVSKKQPKVDVAVAAAAASSVTPTPKKEEIDLLAMIQGRDMGIEAVNTPEALAAHKIATDGKFTTRFPPEPNGFLHLGHCKALNFSFGLANKFAGQTILRLDDTNPDVEKQEYVDSIVDNVTWLGHTPARVTYTSDYFAQLHDLAVVLIQKGKAYVDHQTGEEIEQSRKTKVPSPWRERSVEENLRLFAEMRQGKWPAGKATLRFKGDMAAANPQMWDLVAYRIKHISHPRTGATWCIYPSYDFSHPIVDSLEHIDKSLCTLEFEARRESYYWLLHQLDLWKPQVYEFSRLEVEHTVMSKRRLLRLVEDGHVDGWDDPRLPTLNGFRRRGYPADALKRLCDAVGVTRSKNLVTLALVEHCCRTSLDPLARRALVVSNPIRVVLLNHPEGTVEHLSVPNHPKDASMGSRSMNLTRVVYISSDDFSVSAAAADKNFFGLSLNGEAVYLKYAGCNIVATKVVYKDDGVTIHEVHATMDRTASLKCKSKLNWVADTEAALLQVELRLYDKLFLSRDPAQFDGDTWLNDLNPKSLITTQAYAEASLASAKPGDYYQFERMGFFVCDASSTPDKLVFNRTVALRESKA
jgi:glutaminyl-tRNA synthetase